MCVHEAKERDWARMQNGVMKLHPYCGNCGTLKNVSSDRGKRMGYFIAALSRLRKTLEKKGYKVSDAQIRLIVKELSEREFDDIWWITFSKQKEIYISTVRKYVRVSTDTVEASLLGV